MCDIKVNTEQLWCLEMDGGRGQRTALILKKKKKKSQCVNCVGLKESSTGVTCFHKDVLKQFILLCSLGDI